MAKVAAVGLGAALFAGGAWGRRCWGSVTPRNPCGMRRGRSCITSSAPPRPRRPPGSGVFPRRRTRKRSCSRAATTRARPRLPAERGRPIAPRAMAPRRPVPPPMTAAIALLPRSPPRTPRTIRRRRAAAAPTTGRARRPPPRRRPSTRRRTPARPTTRRPVQRRYSVGPVPRTMTATRRQTVFAGLDQPRSWPPTPRAMRPQRLDVGLDSLPGVAATTQRKLGKLGLATVRDVLEHRPAPVRDGRGRGHRRRASPGRGGGRERPCPQRREAADARAATDADRRAGRRRHGHRQRDVVQPALARRPAEAGHRGTAARQARPLRLRAPLLRHRRRGARHRRLRSGLPRCRGDRRRDGARAWWMPRYRSRRTSPTRSPPSCASARGWR